MNPYELAIAATFWTCGALVVYTYAVYPALIWWLSRRFGRSSGAPACDPEPWPEVTLLIAAYNEEEVIEERIRNALAMDYPRDRIEIVIGLDGCTDDTAAIVRRYDDRGVRLLDYRPATRQGLRAQRGHGRDQWPDRLDVRREHGDRSSSGAPARPLVPGPGVGAVVGRLVLTDPRSGSNADGLYWKYETFLKRCEGRLGALLGANGAIYAIRRDLYVPIPPETIIDDFVIPLLAKLRSGCAIVYECDAVAREETPADVSSEFHRRARIGAGGFQSIGMLWRLLDPRRGWVAFTFFSHKVLRWFCPFFLIGLLASNALLWDTSLLPLGPGRTGRLLRRVAPGGPRAAKREAAQADSVDDDVHKHERRPDGRFRPLAQEAAACRLEADGTGGGSKRSAPMSIAFLLPWILAAALLLLVLAGGGLAVSKAASQRTGPLDFHLCPGAVEVSPTTGRPAGSPAAVHCRPLRAEKRGRLSIASARTDPALGRRLSPAVRAVSRQRRPASATHILLPAGTVRPRAPRHSGRTLSARLR